ncbi:MAG TPA: hypothetical protein VGP76_30095 [Planctomycetaceae bacterium]|nr:hypothetical protein [Planctomycetaceae bacterium]
MEIATFVFIAISGMLGIVWGVFALAHHRDIGIWVACAAVNALVIAVFCHLQNQAWLNDAKSVDSSETSGILIPGNGETPEFRLSPIAKGKIIIPTSAVFLFLGTDVAWTSTFPHAVIRQGDEDMILVEKENSGIFISAKIFDKEGKIICQIVRNRFHLNPDNYFRIERSPNRLVVIDKEVRKTLDVEFINTRAIRFSGTFYLRGGLPITLTQEQQQIGGLMGFNVIGEHPDGASIHFPPASNTTR